MRRCEFFRVLGGVVARFRPRRLIVVAIAVFALLPIKAGDAGWLPDLFKTSSKQAKSPKHAKSARQSTRYAKLAKHRAPSKPRATRLAALGPIALPRSAAKPTAAACDPTTFRIVLDVGHTAESEGAISARNVAEFAFNRRLAQLIEERLKAEGFAETRLLLTEGKARPSLFRRVASANNLHADLLLSIHHDSVPNKMLEDWEFGGKKSHYSDRFSGYSVFVSRENPDFRTSLRFAELVAREMKAGGLRYAAQYSLPIMGSNQHPLLNKDTGVYSYDELIVLRKSAMPAVLLEAGSIINRDEELAMGSPERRNIIAGGVASAVKEFCDPRWALLGPL
ncbi:N-acetylmuramoyl-L-alanine amidase family protein [Bradyrhizobium embrapense]|uniref:N-acetylmuramoyl-L-alanine amidase family protein n=1 Tax=Bradyrhizobium embrapense TaxID=630921 RepID=UPI000ACA872E|nr:N-acetylmuramoyl-L-alanine amidase [Bradyrhizobium embrapense]